MDLQATSSLDLKVTKEDLIDIVIDEQLTFLEAKQESLVKEMDVFREKNT